MTPIGWFAGQSRQPPRKVCEPTRVIDPLEIASAVCRDDHGSPDCFVPKDLHTARKPLSKRFLPAKRRFGPVSSAASYAGYGKK